MLEKIKHYAIVGGLALIGVLAALLKIQSVRLQAAQLKAKKDQLDSELQKAKDAVETKRQEVQDAQTKFAQADRDWSAAHNAYHLYVEQSGKSKDKPS